MKKIGISQFKAQALKILDDIANTREEIIVTKRGKPLVQITPCRNQGQNPIPGQLAGAYVSEQDIITPLGADLWESSQ